MTCCQDGDTAADILAETEALLKNLGKGAPLPPPAGYVSDDEVGHTTGSASESYLQFAIAHSLGRSEPDLDGLTVSFIHGYNLYGRALGTVSR